MAMTPDSKTLFVNIQHPGESPAEVSDPGNPTAISSWPHNADRPRSATVVITHADGGDIGL
jgi:secreted PhoX family phosphatase